MNRWMRRGLTVPFIAGMIFFAYPMVMVFDRRPIVEQTDFRAEPDVLRPGQKFETVWTIETFRPRCNGYTHREIIDSAGQVFAFDSTYAVPHDVVGTETIRARWTLPLGVAPGPARIRRKTARWCNGLQELFWPMWTIHDAEFTVVVP
jgi:hypothetical protein